MKPGHLARALLSLVPALLGGLVSCVYGTQVPGPESASVAAPAGPAAPANRDRHARGDVPTYIDALVSPERVEELQPQLVVSSLELERDALVADLGCGPGVFALPFARACPEGVVFAVDVEPGQLDALRERAEAIGLDNIVPVLASYGDPHLPRGRFDVLFIADTYHHLDDRVDYFRRARAALAPGGRLVIVEYKPGDLPMGPPASHKLPAGKREQELREAGYARVQTFDTHRYHDFEIWEPER